MSAAAVLTPFSRNPAIELGNRRWRKRLLPVGEIHYQGRVLKFTKDYLGGLAQAFTDRAYDQVPFQLAGDANKHTNDVERFGGKITDMSVRDDGLYMELEPTERGERVLRDNPDVGVSARIVEGYDRSDGKFFPKAIQHVLATLDPRIPGLGGWQAIEASGDDVDVTYDLSGAEFAGEENPMPELTETQQARIAQLLQLPADQLEALLTVNPDPAGTASALNGDGNPGDQLTDAELDALVEEALALDAAGLLDAEPEPAGAGLSSENAMAIELATAQSDENARQLGVINAQLDNERWLNERRVLIGEGIPPFITDLAQPLLEGGGHTVDLANGNVVDAGQVMRKVLTEYAKVSGQLGLGVELGSPMDAPDEDATAADTRTATVTRLRAQMGL